MCVHSQSLQSCPTLCDPMDSSPPGSSVHGILQARILECVAIPFSRGSSRPSQISVSYISCIAGRLFFFFQTAEPPRSPLGLSYLKYFCSLFPQVTEVSLHSLQPQKTIEEPVLQIDKALPNGEKGLAGTGLRSEQLSRFLQFLLTYLSGISSYNRNIITFCKRHSVLSENNKWGIVGCPARQALPCPSHPDTCFRWCVHWVDSEILQLFLTLFLWSQDSKA